MSFRGGILSKIYHNFLRTRTIKQHDKLTPKICVGADNFGNKYYEQQGNDDLSIKKRRWVEALNPDPTLVPKVPIEWDSWLRGRRVEPPAHLELKDTTSRIPSRQEQKSDAAHSINRDDKSVPFPKYDDLETKPGGSAKRDE